jgi:hypothetical protein
MRARVNAGIICESKNQSSGIEYRSIEYGVFGRVGREVADIDSMDLIINLVMDEVYLGTHHRLITNPYSNV